MSRLVIVEDEAEAELAEGANWYEARSPGLGLEFLEAVEAVFERLASTTDLSLAIPRQPRARRILLKRFPYAVVFRVRDDVVRVVAVAHLAKRPGYWRQR